MAAQKVFLMILLAGSFNSSFADMSSVMNCQSTGKIKILNKKNKPKMISKGFSILKKNNEALVIVSDKGHELIKVFPWYGIHYKAEDIARSVKIETDDKTYIDLSVKYKRKRYSLSCQKRD